MSPTSSESATFQSLQLRHYSAIYTTHSLKALRRRSHSFTCKLHHACLSFVSVQQMAPPITQVAYIQLQLTTDLSTPKGRKAELAWLVDP